MTLLLRRSGSELANLIKEAGAGQETALSNDQCAINDHPGNDPGGESRETCR